MAIKDIEKLKEKFDKDPNSKLFLPLAEEYRKEGMLDEAIEALQTGLEKHKAYTSARVLLGKIYIEKGMPGEAREEFENVIASVPDNLFSHKKLAEIYRDTGESELAIKAFKAILKLNPMDEEALNNLKDLEGVAAPPLADQGQPTAAVSGFALKMPEEPAAEMKAAEPSEEEIRVDAAADVQAEHSEEDLNAFKESLFGNKGPVDEEIELDTSEDESVEEQVQDLTFGDAVEVGQEEVQEAAPEIPAAEPEFRRDFSFKEVAEEGVQEEGAVQDVTEAEVSETPEIGDFTEDLTEMEAMVRQPESAPEGLDAADRFVGEGNYSAAMGIYRKRLSLDPENKAVLQRVDELRALLKLLGKDKEVLIAKLDAFLQGINKRRDEFFGRS
jgi:tetratricopeptide (TPR) repeat protein